jgi:hypothetical protein
MGRVFRLHLKVLQLSDFIARISAEFGEAVFVAPRKNYC